MNNSCSNREWKPGMCQRYNNPPKTLKRDQSYNVSSFSQRNSAFKDITLGFITSYRIVHPAFVLVSNLFRMLDPLGYF